MRRKTFAAAALALLCAATAHPAHATPTSYREWLNVCGGAGLPGMTMCGSVKVQVTGTHVQLWVQNLSGLNGSYKNFVITQISFFNANPGGTMPNVIEGTVQNINGPYRASNSSNPPPAWTVSNVNGSGGVFGLDFDGGVNGNDGSLASSCGDNLPGGSNDLWMTPACGILGVDNVGDGWLSMEFDTDSFWDLNASNTQLQIHGQSNIGSIKCTTSIDCDDPEITTPEPATLTLLGTGLVAVAGALRRRRSFRRGGSDLAA